MYECQASILIFPFVSSTINSIFQWILSIDQITSPYLSRYINQVFIQAICSKSMDWAIFTCRYFFYTYCQHILRTIRIPYICCININCSTIIKLTAFIANTQIVDACTGFVELRLVGRFEQILFVCDTCTVEVSYTRSYERFNTCWDCSRFITIQFTVQDRFVILNSECCNTFLRAYFFNREFQRYITNTYTALVCIVNQRIVTCCITFFRNNLIVFFQVELGSLCFIGCYFISIFVHWITSNPLIIIYQLVTIVNLDGVITTVQLRSDWTTVTIFFIISRN